VEIQDAELRTAGMREDGAGASTRDHIAVNNSPMGSYRSAGQN